MGLFQHKQNPAQSSQSDEVTTAVEHLFDEALREQLREQAKEYFERVISENAVLFKQDLDATVAHVNTELRQQATRQLDEQLQAIASANTELKEGVARRFDEQFAEYEKTMNDAQNLALQSIERSAKALEEQHRQLSVSLEKSIANQDAMLTSAITDNQARIEQIEDAQNTALQVLSSSAKALEEQHKQLGDIIEKSVAEQKAMMTDMFEQNMARIIEHYLLGALGDQYDLKAQLPAIIKQMEENKQAIVDDMKL